MSSCASFSTSAFLIFVSAGVSGESLSLRKNWAVGQDPKVQNELMAIIYGRQQCDFASIFAHTALAVIL